MRRTFTLLLALSIMLSLAACIIQSRQDTVLDSIGKYEKKQFWTHGAFQDYTDFGIYTCQSTGIEKSSYFSKVSQEDIGVICEFIDNYEGWVEAVRENDPTDALVLNYRFDRSILDIEDYFYIYEGEEPYPKFGCYDIWIFDNQTNVLYYFHNNI